MGWFSIEGLFVRRISVAFEKLSFNQVIKLYNRFCVKFRETLREIPEKQRIEEFFHIPDQSMDSHSESDMAKENLCVSFTFVKILNDFE